MGPGESHEQRHGNMNAQMPRFLKTGYKLPPGNNSVLYHTYGPLSVQGKKEGTTMFLSCMASSHYILTGTCLNSARSTVRRLSTNPILR